MGKLVTRFERRSYRELIFILPLVLVFAFFPATVLARKSGSFRQELTGYVLYYKGELVFTEQPDSTFTLYSLEFRDPPRNNYKFCEYQDYQQCNKQTVSFSQVIKLRNHFQLSDVVISER